MKKAIIILLIVILLLLPTYFYYIRKEGEKHTPIDQQQTTNNNTTNNNTTQNETSSLNYLEDVFRGLTYIPSNLSDVTFRVFCESPLESPRQEYVYFRIYNRTGLQTLHWQPIPYEEHVNISVVIPPDPPYLITAYHTGVGTIELFGNFTHAKRLINTSGPDYTIGNPPYYIIGYEKIYSLVVDAGFTQNTTCFYVNNTTDAFYAGADIINGSRYGELTVKDSSERLVGGEEHHIGSDTYYNVGPSDLTGEWIITLTLDKKAVTITQWDVCIKGHYINPLISELGFDFSYEGY